MTPIETVRLNTNEPNDKAAGGTYDDADITALLNDNDDSTDAVSSIIWRHKAAKWSSLVNITEGPAKEELSKLFDNAIALATMYAKVSGLGSLNRTRLHKIERS